MIKVQDVVMAIAVVAMMVAIAAIAVTSRCDARHTSPIIVGGVLMAGCN